MSELDLTGVESVQWRTIFKTLATPGVSELYINGPDNVFYKYKGRHYRLATREGQTMVSWADAADFARTMRDVEPRMAKYGESYADAFCIFEGGLRLKNTDGSLVVAGRFHCLKPPVCDFPEITITKASTGLTTIDALVKSGSMTSQMGAFIKILMKHRQTLVFSGGTGAGKTTFLNACASLISPEERIAICEDAPELEWHDHLPNTVNIHSFPRQPGKKAEDQASLSWVVAQTTRMRIDRVIVGETRDASFADFLTAANSGFDGSMTTLHANAPRLALDKMFSFTKRAPGNASTPPSSINSDIAHAINYIIQLGRPRGRYRCLAIEEVSDIVSDSDSAKVKTNPIFQYNGDADSWRQVGYPEKDDIREDFMKTMNDTMVSSPATSAASSGSRRI